MLKNIFFLLLILVAFTGCWGEKDKKDVLPTDDVNASEVIGGHVLPPEPDPAVNKGTLLGVDVNGNGVRDDVERYIYMTYPSAVRREILMQGAKSHQAMLADPDAVDNAQKWQKVIANKLIACKSYLFRNFKIEYEIRTDEEMENLLYNTKERLKKYIRYNDALGGGVYGVEEEERVESACEFNVTKALQDEQ
jgi:hypothetical protein